MGLAGYATLVLIAAWGAGYTWFMLKQNKK